jgi:HEAT repeat protein
LESALERALDDADPEVRLETVEVIDRGGLTDASSILTKALGDDDPNVRQLGLHVGLSQTPLVRQALVSKAAASPHADVALTALSVMEAEPDKRNIPYFTAALSHPDLTVRDQARETLALTFHELFQSAEGARTWWAANQHRYSQNLVEEIVAPGGL